MIREVIMPAMGMTMQEGTIVKWLKKEGEPVESGEPLLEIMTDKLTMEVESPASGVLRKILAAEGQVVPVTQVIAYVGRPGDPIPGGVPGKIPGADEGPEVTPRAAAPRATVPRAAAPRAIATEPVIPPGPTAAAAEVSTQQGPMAAGQIRATPAARRVAREKGVDISLVKGTGPGGRIEVGDVDVFRPAFVAAGVTAGVTAGGAPEQVHLTAMRGAIARNMAESSRTTASFSISTEVDALPMSRLREETKEMFNYANPAAKNYDFQEALTEFTSGRSAMAELWTTALLYADDPAKSKVVGKASFAGFPRPEENLGKKLPMLYIFWGFTVAETAKDKNGAFEWIKYVTSKDAEVRAAVHGNIPARFSALDDPKLQARFLWLKPFREAMANCIPTPMVPLIPEGSALVNQHLVPAVAEYMAGANVDAKSLLDKAAVGVTQLMTSGGYYK